MGRPTPRRVTNTEPTPDEIFTSAVFNDINKTQYAQVYAGQTSNFSEI